jgi:hypothetical protein
MRGAELLVSAYAQAVRSGNETKIEEVRMQMDALELEVLETIPESSDHDNVVNRIQNYISSMFSELRSHVERSETLIRERVGDAITRDSDSDDIADYDEISLYKTDPLVADTDNDGFTDSVEILNGYDPINSAAEANIIYESPKEAGLIREDLLTVRAISAMTQNGETNASALITGTGLPNSFVRLYIFSTPIVVTVKTDTQGNWSYIFDKELEDGEHEVYVGITDNAGKIVAKSNSFAFVKTAEAFAPVGGTRTSDLTEARSPMLVGEQMMFVVGSVTYTSWSPCTTSRTTFGDTVVLC